MPLSPEQRAALEAEADRRGVDRAALIREAEALVDGGDEQEPSQRGGNADAPPSGEQPKLFMYLLPFVKVREVRQKWLGLTESFPGDNEVASKWALKMGGGGGDDTTEVPEE